MTRSIRSEAESSGPGREKRDFEALTQRRLRAGKMFMAGASQVEVARALGVSRMTACRWAAAWRENRWDGLRGPGRAGPLPKLSGAQLEEVERVLGEGPQSYGLAPGEPWTAPRVAVMIEKVTGVAYTTAGARSLLVTRLGWRRLRPDPTAPADSDVAVSWVRDRPVSVIPTPATAAGVDRLLRRVEHSPG